MIFEITSRYALIGFIITTNIFGGSLSTNGIPELIKDALPAGMRVAPPEYGRILKRGHFGNVAHFYIEIFDQRNRKISLNTQVDAFFVLVSDDYTYPDTQTENAYSKYFLTRTARFQAFLLAPMNTDPVWEQLRTKLKEALDH